MMNQDSIKNKTGQVATTLADTLSNSKEKSLRNAVSNSEDHVHSTISTIRTCVGKHPIKAAGIAVLCGLLISSIIKPKTHNQ